MLQLTYLLFQLDEARRYIEDGRQEQLRLALLLLDNAIEMQMNRAITYEMIYEGWNETLLKQIEPIPESELTGHLQDVAKFVPLGKSRKEKIEKFFAEKVKYLSVRKARIDPRLVKPLLYLHKYRNEAYHKTELRPETVRTSALIYLEINCMLLKHLRGGGFGHYSGDDYSWLEETFNLKPLDILLDEDFLDIATQHIRGALLPDAPAVAGLLAEHLEGRIEELYRTLDNLMRDLEGLESRERALEECEFYWHLKATKDGEPLPIRAEFIPKYALNDVSDIANEIDSVRVAESRLASFSRFSDLEERVEPIEACVNELAIDVDQKIQMEIDIARGK